MEIKCPYCNQKYEVENNSFGARFICSVCNKEFKAPHKSYFAISAIIAILILCVITLVIFTFAGMQKGLANAKAAKKATPWGAICDYVKPTLARPNTAKFAPEPETVKELENGWLYLAGTVETLNVAGQKVTPLIEAKIKEYDNIPLETDDVGIVKGVFYKDKYYVIEKLIYAGITTHDYTKYNEEIRKMYREERKAKSQ